MATSATPIRSGRHNLPASVTSFIGRERELADVQTRLGEARLLTLTGVGGCGKTRLALEVGRAVLDHYHDGVWLVELGPLADPSLVPHSVAAVVGGSEIAGQSTTGALIARLRARRLLLVLDNCEHLLDACARLVDALLRACPNIHVLITSREALGITGEITWRVPSLPVPDLQRLPSLARLGRNPAIKLFTERAVATQSHFVLTERNAPAVAQVCTRLDGIPLALELAAARVAALSVDQIAARLDQRFRLLTGGSRAALPRQRTLRATLDWSYELLTESERCLLNRLAVFAGGWSLEAAEAVCVGAHVGDDDVLDLVGRLVSKSLVVAEEEPDGTERYRLLETVREYAREQLVKVVEMEAVHQQHANYFLAFAEALGPDVLRGSSVRQFISSSLLDQLEREHDNLRAALRWWIESQDADRALRQAAALFPIWFLRGSLTEGRAWLEEVLALPTARDAPEVKIHALPMLANLARRQGEVELSVAAFNALLAEMESAGDTRGAAQVVSDLANVHYLSGDFTAGWTCLERSRAIAGDLRDPVLESRWRFVGGQLALHEGRYELARSLLAEELEMAGPQSGTLHSGYVLMNLGSVCREQGDYVEADRLLTQGLQVAERYGDNSLLPLSVAGMSALATALGQHERALCLAGAAAALREVTGAAAHSPVHRSMFERWLAASRAALSDGAAAAAWQAGQEMSAKQAVAFAQASSAPTMSDTPAAAGPERTTIQGPLTRREIEVAALIAQGLSNRQIAERLVITSRTVASHIENILEKLAFTSRTQIAVWAMEHGLVASSLA